MVSQFSHLIFCVFCAIFLAPHSSAFCSSAKATTPPDTLDPRLAVVAAPRMVLDSDVINVGRLSASRHDKGKATFVFTNKGDAPLRIEGCQASCDCTEVTYRTKAVKPGKQGKIHVTIDVADQPQLGPFCNVITILFDSPQRYTNIRVTGEFVN